MALNPEERTLIARAVKRDPEAFSELYVRFYEPVLRRVSLIVGERQDAEDVTSEAFLRAWNAIERFQDRDVSILAWFVTIAERIAIKHMRGRRPSVDIEDVVLGASPETLPEVMLLRVADMENLKAAMEALPPIQREIVTKRFLEDFSYGELGSELGKPVGTVRVIQHRALKALKGILSAKVEPSGPRPVLRSRTPDA
jgi:RNA polymerase sigma-70 factor (ECF subfamily)